MEQILSWVGGGGVGAVLVVVIRGLLQWRKSEAEIEDSRVDATVKRLEAHLDRTERELKDDRTNLIQLHQDYAVLMVTNARNEQKIFYLEAEIARMNRERGVNG